MGSQIVVIGLYRIWKHLELYTEKKIRLRQFRVAQMDFFIWVKRIFPIAQMKFRLAQTYFLFTSNGISFDSNIFLFVSDGFLFDSHIFSVCLIRISIWFQQIFRSTQTDFSFGLHEFFAFVWLRYDSRKAVDSCNAFLSHRSYTKLHAVSRIIFFPFFFLFTAVTAHTRIPTVQPNSNQRKYTHTHKFNPAELKPTQLHPYEFNAAKTQPNPTTLEQT